MKNTLIILVLFLAFAGCKHEELPYIEPEPIYEEWTKVSSDIISKSSRNVLALETYDSNLYIQCLKSYYHLDKNLNKVRSYIKGLEKEPWVRKGPVIGEKYAIHKEETSGYGGVFFKISNTVNPFDDKHLLIIDSLGAIPRGIHSGVTSEGEFGILYASQLEHSINYYYDTYLLEQYKETPNRLNTLSLGKGSIEGGVYDVSIINGVAYCSYYNRMSRVENGIVTDEFPFNLRDVSVYKDALVGVADNNWRGMPDEPELLISYNKGIDWTPVMQGVSLSEGNLKVVEDQILLISGSWVLILNINDGTFKVVDMGGTDAYFKDVTKLGNKAVLGTDAGVYYKSWESFINK